VEKEVLEFKSALESVIKKENYVEFGLARFPSGSCEVASLIYGCYLLQNYSEVKLVYGDRVHRTHEGQENKHVWLEIDGLQIDLTAGQFDDSETDVIVKYESKFLNTFKVNKKEKPSLAMLISLICDTPEYYKSIYEKVCNELRGT